MSTPKESLPRLNLQQSTASSYSGLHSTRSSFSLIQTPLTTMKSSQSFRQKTPQTSPIQKVPIPISQEFDLLLTNHKSLEEVDRSKWEKQVLSNNPEISFIRQSVNPLVRAAHFGRLFIPQKRLIPHHILFVLISQHLRVLGLTESQASLHSEWGSELHVPPHKDYSQLSLLIQRALFRTEKFWLLSMPSIHAPNDPKLIKNLLDEEISQTLGSAPKIIEDENPITNEEPFNQNFLKYDEGGKQDIKTASLNQLIYVVTIKEKEFGDLFEALCYTVFELCNF